MTDIKKTKQQATDSKFISRDLSWLDFNRRVLYLVSDKNVPFLERLKFLGISSSNLDEFIRVRLTVLYKNAIDDGEKQTIFDMSRQEEFSKVLEGIKDYRILQNNVYKIILKELYERNIHIVPVKNLDSGMTKSAKKIFIEDIFPSLTPITYESTKEPPFVKSGELGIIVEASESRHSKSLFTYIPISKVNDRLICVDNKSNTYVLIEDLIKSNVDIMFNKKNIHYVGYIRILRQADIQLDTDSQIYLVDRMIDFLYKREQSDVIFAEVSDNMPKNVIKVVKKIIGTKNKFIMKTDMSDFTFMNKYSFGLSETYVPFEPQEPQELVGEESIMEAIDDNDILLSHPYDSYDPVIQLIEEAADDPSVMVIRNTLYRVSSEDSPIIKALCKAARNGKQVAVLLELKARFDEEQNISIIKQLSRAGIQITYGLENLKTHCKLLSILKKDNSGLRYYTHIATGNYNDKTARMYTDISYFTCSKKIGDDVINIFNFISGFTNPNPIKSKRVFYSPKSLRKKIEVMIDKEIDNVSKGKEGKIIIKINSLSDKKMMNKLYEASNKGVKIELIVRGICSIKPINDNIIIKSIVGRYLEHARIYYFYNGGKSKVFIGSADLLTRNLDKRVELLVEVDDRACKRKLINVLCCNLKDTENSFYMTSKGKYITPERKEKKSVNVFDVLMKVSKNDITLPKKKKKI